MLKVLGKLSREQKKKVKVAASEKKTGNENETETSETSTSEDYSRQIQELLSKIKASKKRLRHENREMIKQLIVPLVPPALIIFLVSIVFLSAVGTVKLTPWIRVIHSLAYSVSLVALGFFLLYGFARFTLQLRIRKCDDDYEQLMQLFDETEEYSDNKYPRNNWKSLRLNDVLKDEQIKTTLITLLGFLVFYFIIHSFVANSSQSNRKEFPICYVDEAPYIVVYQSSNTYYLDQAVISDCQITIDTRAHRVINSDDVSFTSTKFEAVTILRD